MTSFSTRDVRLDGVQLQVLEAGDGQPIVYFHGAGAARGFDELLPLARDRRLIVPFHPGFGGSGDDPRITTVLDYVVHYGSLFDALALEGPIDLVGHSLGGWIATLFAIFSGHRVRRLALACPAGLRVPDHPSADLFMIPPDALPPYLVARPEAMAQLARGGASVEAQIARYREMTSLARLIWDSAYELKLTHWLKRIAMPTLVLWGDKDRVLPVGQADHWARGLGGDPEVTVFDDTGHLVFFENPDAIERVERFFHNA